MECLENHDVFNDKPALCTDEEPGLARESCDLPESFLIGEDETEMCFPETPGRRCDCVIVMQPQVLSPNSLYIYIYI